MPTPFPSIVLRALIGIVLPAALLCGCGEVLEPGQWGTFRYFNQLSGETPMRLVPPLSDRDGNVYVLHGNEGWLGGTVFVGHHLGGWSGGCQLHTSGIAEGTVKGLLGTGQDQAWWWSGITLGKVSGETGMCQRIIRYDPISQAEVNVLAAVPWIEETPSRTTLLAMVQSYTDDHPYIVVVDLALDRYTEYRSYDPDGHSDLYVLGTGGSDQLHRGYIVTTYLRSGNRVVEAVVLDETGETVATVPIDLTLPAELAADIDQYAVQGFLQVSDGGLVAGLLGDGRVLVFNEERGGPKTIEAFTPRGLAKYDGRLWVTGEQGGEPVAAELDDGGSLGGPSTFSAAKQAARSLEGSITVVDERTDPSEDRSWDDARTALSTYPMVTPYPLDVYTTGSTGWLVAGPTYAGPNEEMNAVAFAPLGIELP